MNIPHFPPARALSGLLLPLLLAACASNPTGGTDFVLMSERAELEKGAELHEAMLKENPVYAEPSLQAYVNSVGQKMAKVGDRPDLDYTFTIIDSPDINAFALPGGHIYINRGLLAYLNSEAQLAAVLGHEIGHVTARHSVRQQTAARSTNVLSTAANIAVFVASGGIATLGGTGDLVGGALLSGYGRNMELEADELGAKYLAKAGYDPQAMVEVITVLKNQEDFNKKVANKAPSYHGLFSTHPRNDTRLREGVTAAGRLADAERAEVDPAVFRQRLSGLPLGRAMQTAGQQDRNRYYQNLLGYTLVFPDAWEKAETTTTVTASGEGGEIRVEAMRLQEIKDPRLFLTQDLGIQGLQKAERISQFGLSGYTGVDPASSTRVAVFYYGPRAFVITGSAAQDSAQDERILATIRSFRPIDRNERMLADPVKIEYVQADGRVTYADLARQARPGLQYPVETLRLLNGHYPSSEPRAGEWVKLAR